MEKWARSEQDVAQQVSPAAVTTEQPKHNIPKRLPLGVRGSLLSRGYLVGGEANGKGGCHPKMWRSRQDTPALHPWNASTRGGSFWGAGCLPRTDHRKARGGDSRCAIPVDPPLHRRSPGPARSQGCARQTGDRNFGASLRQQELSGRNRTSELRRSLSSARAGGRSRRTEPNAHALRRPAVGVLRRVAPAATVTGAVPDYGGREQRAAGRAGGAGPGAGRHGQPVWPQEAEPGHRAGQGHPGEGRGGSPEGDAAWTLLRVAAPCAGGAGRGSWRRPRCPMLPWAERGPRRCPSRAPGCRTGGVGAGRAPQVPAS